VLQCLCCSVLQRVAACFAVWWNVLQCVAVCCGACVVMIGRKVSQTYASNFFFFGVSRDCSASTFRNGSGHKSYPCQPKRTHRLGITESRQTIWKEARILNVWTVMHDYYWEGAILSRKMPLMERLIDQLVTDGHYFVEFASRSHP